MTKELNAELSADNPRKFSRANMQPTLPPAEVTYLV